MHEWLYQPMEGAAPSQGAMRLAAAFVAVTIFASSLTAESSPAPAESALAAASPDSLSGVYEGALAHLSALFPGMSANRGDAQKIVILHVQRMNRMLQFEAVAPGEVQTIELPIEGHWDQAAAEFTVSIKKQRGFWNSHEGLPPGYGWSTEIVKVFLNARHALVVEHKLDWRLLAYLVRPMDTMSYDERDEFAPAPESPADLRR